MLRALALVCTVAAAARAQTCAAADGPVRCSTCTISPYSDVNIATGLPRFTATFTSVSSNIGQYRIFDCKDATDPNESCQPSADLNPSAVAGSVPTSSSTSLVAYGESISMYAGIAVILGVLGPLLALCFCICRCNLTCCLCGVIGGMWCCGRGQPTPRAPDSTCACGFEEVRNPLADAKDDATTSSGPRFHYRPCDRWATRICLMVYFALVVGFGAMAHFMGSARLTGGMTLMVKAVDAVVPVISGLETTMQGVVVTLSADVAAPGITIINDTIHAHTSPKNIIAKTLCVADGVGNTASAVNAIAGNISSVTSTVKSVQSILDNVEGNVTAVQANVNSLAGLRTSALRTSVVSLGSVRDATPGVAAQVSAAIDGIDASLTSFRHPTTGLPAVAERMAWYNGRPTSSEATQSATDVQAMATGTMAGPAAQSPRTAAIGRLDTLATKAANLSGVTSLAGLLDGLNADLATFRNEDRAGAVLRAINATRDLIASLPNVTATLELANTTTSLADSTKAAVVPVRASIVELENLLGKLNLTFIDEAERQLAAADTIIACVTDMRPDLAGINASIVQLPSVLDSVLETVSSLNGSLASARGFIGTAKEQGDALDTQLAAFDFNAYLASIDSVIATDVGDTGNIGAQGGGITDAVAAVNLDAVYDSVVEVNVTVSRPSLTVNATTLQTLRDVAPLFANMSNASAAALAAARTYDKPRCSDTGAVCTSAVDCTAPATCDRGLALCVPEATPDAGQAGASSCQPPATCGAGEVCTLDSTLLAGTAVALNAYADAPAPDLTAAGSAVSSMQASVASVSGLDSARSSVASLNSSLASVSFNGSAVASLLDTAFDAADTAKSTLDTVLTTITDVRGQLSIISVLESVEGLVSTAQSAVSSASSSTSIIRGAADALRTFQDFWYGEFPLLLSSRLSRAALEADAERGGTVAVLRSVVHVLQRSVDILLDAAKGVTGSALSFPINATEQLNTVEPLLTVFGDKGVQAQGAAHFGLRMAGEATSAFNISLDLPTIVDPAHAPAGSGVFADASRRAWPDNAICVTRSCIDSSVESFNQDQMGVVIEDVSAGAQRLSQGSESGGGISIPIPVSRELALSLPLVLPVLVALFGLLPVMCCCRCSCQPCCVRCLTCWNQCLTCGCSACLFLLFGAVLFPVILFAADGCRSGPNIALTYVSGSEAFLCNIVTGRLTEPGACIVTVEAGGANTDVSLNIPRLTASLLGEGGCSDAGRAEVTTAFRAVGGLADAFLESAANTTVPDAAAGANLALRDPVRLAVLQIARLAGNAAKSVLGDLGSSVLSCDNVNGAFAAVTDGLCCGVVSPMYWIVSAYYLIALAMCTFGWCGSVFAYKRLPNELWGVYYEDALAMPLDARNKRLFERKQEEEAKGGLGAASMLHPHSAKVTPEQVVAAERQFADGEFLPTAPTGAPAAAAAPRPPRAKPMSSTAGRARKGGAVV